MGELIPFPAVAPLDEPTARRPRTPEPLWREAVGKELRDERRATERTLADVAEDAGVSTQYLSEIERGLKEPSSEVLQAVIGALDLRLVDLTIRVARQLSQVRGPVCLAA
jgi:hypothetical protein